MRRLLPCGLLACLAARPAEADAPKIAYDRFEPTSGLRVHVVGDHRSPMVYEVIWSRVGSRDEVAHRTGFAHPFEHLVFKGSAPLPAK